MKITYQYCAPELVDCVGLTYVTTHDNQQINNIEQDLIINIENLKNVYAFARCFFNDDTNKKIKTIENSEFCVIFLNHRFVDFRLVLKPDQKISLKLNVINTTLKSQNVSNIFFQYQYELLHAKLKKQYSNGLFGNITEKIFQHETVNPYYPINSVQIQDQDQEMKSLALLQEISDFFQENLLSQPTEPLFTPLIDYSLIGSSHLMNTSQQASVMNDSISNYFDHPNISIKFKHSITTAKMVTCVGLLNDQTKIHAISKRIFIYIKNLSKSNISINVFFKNNEGCKITLLENSLFYFTDLYKKFINYNQIILPNRKVIISLEKQKKNFKDLYSVFIEFNDQCILNTKIKGMNDHSWASSKKESSSFINPYLPIIQEKPLKIAPQLNPLFTPSIRGRFHPYLRPTSNDQINFDHPNISITYKHQTKKNGQQVCVGLLNDQTKIHGISKKIFIHIKNLSKSSLTITAFLKNDRNRKVKSLDHSAFYFTYLSNKIMTYTHIILPKEEIVMSLESQKLKYSNSFRIFIKCNDKNILTTQIIRIGDRNWASSKDLSKSGIINPYLPLNQESLPQLIPQPFSQIIQSTNNRFYPIDLTLDPHNDKPLPFLSTNTSTPFLNDALQDAMTHLNELDKQTEEIFVENNEALNVLAKDDEHINTFSDQSFASIDTLTLNEWEKLLDS